jgi:hypothetical protein
MIVVFEGHSDDIVAFAVGKSIAKLERDETDVDRHGRRGFIVATPGQTRGIAVVATYGVVGGTWTFAYGQLDEGRQLPRWAFTTEIAHGYSTRLVIDTIDDLVEVLPQRKEND